MKKSAKQEIEESGLIMKTIYIIGLIVFFVFFLIKWIIELIIKLIKYIKKQKKEKNRQKEWEDNYNKKYFNSTIYSINTPLIEVKNIT